MNYVDRLKRGNGISGEAGKTKQFICSFSHLE